MKHDHLKTSVLSPLRIAGGIAFSTLLSSSLAHAQGADVSEIAAQVRALKTQVSALEERLAEAEAKAREAEAKATAAQSSHDERSDAGEDNPSLLASDSGDGWWQRTSVGGYGEMHLSLGGLDPDGAPGNGNRDDIDYHRWVLFFAHQFSDRIKLFSELEVEHSIAAPGKTGEVELEQAYVEFDLGSDRWLKTGLFLIPVGFLNETHEPDTFFGVDRNPVETQIIPTTWWEGGAAYGRRFESGLSYDLAYHSSLDIPASGQIRSGRQKVSQASTGEGAGTARLTYRGIPGLEVGGTVQINPDVQPSQAGSTQGLLWETHLGFRYGGFGFKGLYAAWEFDQPLFGVNSAAIDRQHGYYLEPSYTFDTDAGKLGLFYQFGDLEYASSGSMRDEIFHRAGLNYWPIDQVVLKLDYTKQERVGRMADDDTWNLGVGYSF